MKHSEILNNYKTFFFYKLPQFIFGVKFWWFYSSILILSILQNGVWYSPQTERLWLMSENIFANPFLDQPKNQWLLSSFLGPLLGYVTSANRSIYLYSLLHLIIFIIFFTVMIAVAKQRHGDYIARSVLILFFLSPISNVLFTWLGSPDIITFLLSMALILFEKNIPVLVISAFLLGMNHPEQGLVILILLAIFTCTSGERPKEVFKFALVGIGSLLLGKFLVGWYFEIFNFDVTYSRAEYISNGGLYLYVKSTLSNPFAMMFSLYNILYIFIAIYLAYYWKKEKIAFAFLVYSLLAFTVILFTLDQTRVFSILTFPGLLLLVFSPTFRDSPTEQKEFFQNVLSILLLAGIFIPRFTILNGEVHFSSYQYLVETLHNAYRALLFH